MADVWPNENSRERCKQCGRKAANNSIIVNQMCEICTQFQPQRPAPVQTKTLSEIFIFVIRNILSLIWKLLQYLYQTLNEEAPTPVRAQIPGRKLNTTRSYGEYRCTCGRYWDSRLSWEDSYQICKNCKNHVYPHSLRPVQPSDLREEDGEKKEHERDLCQKCRQLGYYCGYSASNRTRYSTYGSRSDSIRETNDIH